MNYLDNDMNLVQMCETGQYNTDKYFDHPCHWHSYIENFYSDKFEPIKESVQNLLEIGVYGGGSLKLWKDYFTKATIFGIDIDSAFFESEGIIQIKGDAYSDALVNCFKDNYFDVIIDDGPHTAESQILFIQKYFSKVKKDGLLICEDISSRENLNEIINALPLEYKLEFKNRYQVFDLTQVDKRYDSIVLCVQK